jgi:phage-related minor tail protein
MASQNIARLGVVLGLDTAEFTASIDKAISENAKLKNAIRRDTNSAAGELKTLIHATEDYGKALTKVQLIQRETTSGRFMNATDDMKKKLLDQAAAYDKVANVAKSAADAASKLAAQQSLVQKDSNAGLADITALRNATEDYGRTLTKVELIQREISSGKYANATQEIKNQLLQQAAAYDKVALAAKNAADTQQKLNEQQNAVKRDSSAAATEINNLKNATEDYGKTLTKVELTQREITSGRFMNATQQMKTQLLQQAAAYDKVALSSKNAAGATFKMNEQQKIQLTYQTTDFFTQIVSGQSPFLAAFQQGGQLKDVMGGVGNMFRAIGSLITPFTVGMTAVAASIGAVAYSFINADKEAAAFRDNMILTGRYAGVTESQVSALSQKLGTDLNVGYSKANDVILALVSSGKFTSAVIDDMSKVILQFSKLSGVDAKEAAQKLMGAFDGTAASVRSLNSQYNFLTLEQYKQIVAYEKAGKAQEAIKLGVKAFGDSIDGQVRDLGTLERAWKAVGEAVTYVKDAILSIGRNSDQDKLVKLAEDIERISSDIGGTDTQSIANRSNNKKLLKEKMDDYLALSKKMQDDVAAAQIASDKKVADQKGITDLAKYGSMLISKDFEVEKAKADAAYKFAERGKNEIEKLELESQKKIADAALEMRQKNQQEDGRATAQNLEIYNSKVLIAETELAEKKRQINAKRMIAQYNDEEAAANEFNTAWAIENNRRGALVVGAQNQTRDMEFQRESLELKYKMIYATEQEQRLAQISLEYARKRKEVEGQDPLVLKELNKQEEIAKMFVTMDESAKRTQQVFDSVFGNLSSAIDNFVKTGKLSMKDLARSIIQDLIAIQMKAAVMRFLGAAFGLATGPNASNDGWFKNVYQAAGVTEKATGGPVSAGSPYIVGERGPELFMPSGSGTIIPNNQMGGMGGQTINYNGPIIQNMSAIDTQSGLQFLAKNKQGVFAAYQSANRSIPVSR